jgi:spore germination protein YaaH
MLNGKQTGRSLLLLLWLGSAGIAADPYSFKEIWAYLMKGEERYLSGNEPITDLCYFSARVNDVGRLDATIRPPQIPRPRGLKRRYHLVISAPASKTLMYFCLNRDYETREALIGDILRLSGPFDGVQIDFEVMRPEERSYYVSFLATIKRRLGPNKILSVALPARTAKLDDAFDYRAIAGAVDRVLVMAYDEHWRTGSPGPIASTDWCEKVLRFAVDNVRDEKLIMGLPLYGRMWQTDDLARALKYPETLELWENRGKPTVGRAPGQTPHFRFRQEVNLAVYWEDMQSLGSKLTLYQRGHIQGVGFWRVGQGPAALWDQLRTMR